MYFSPIKPFASICSPLRWQCLSARMKRRQIAALPSSWLLEDIYRLCLFPGTLRAACSHFFLPKSQWLVTQQQPEKLNISEDSARWMRRIKLNPGNTTVFARWTWNPRLLQSDLAYCCNFGVVHWLQCLVRVWLMLYELWVRFVFLNNVTAHLLHSG